MSGFLSALIPIPMATPRCTYSGTPVAVVIPRPGCALPEAELRARAVESLSVYKRPEAYVAVTRQEVPLGGTAKPQRAALAALAERALAPVG